MAIGCPIRTVEIRQQMIDRQIYTALTCSLETGGKGGGGGGGLEEIGGLFGHGCWYMDAGCRIDLTR